MEVVLNSIYPFLGLLLLVVLLGTLEAGRRLGLAHRNGGDGSAGAGTGAIEGAVFALFGLLLAFTFSGAASRFDHRRDLVVLEANAIGTAYLRIDLLDAEAQRSLRPLFRSYVESRLRTYEAIDEGADAFQRGLDESFRLQGEIWRIARDAAARAGTPAVMTLVLPPINDMIDITTTRVAALRTHPPAIIYVLLVTFAVMSALVAGYGMSVDRHRQWLHMLLFAVAIAGTIYVILDIEYPRQGFIRVDGIDLHMKELLGSMK